MKPLKNRLEENHHQQNELSIMELKQICKNFSIRRGFFHFINNYSFSTSIPLIGDQIPMTISPRKTFNNNDSKVVLPTLNDKNLSADLSIDTSESFRYIPKRRSVSAATTNSITAISLTERNLRESRTHSASNINSPRTKSSFNRKRSYSPSSLTLTSPNKPTNQRKKQKVSNYWVLFGKSEQKLVSIHVCYPLYSYS